MGPVGIQPGLRPGFHGLGHNRRPFMVRTGGGERHGSRPYADNIPPGVHGFQGMFAIITPALITGAFGGADEVQHLRGLHRSVGDDSLCAGGPLGVGRQTAGWADWEPWTSPADGGPHQLGNRGPGSSPDRGTPPGVQDAADASAQRSDGGPGSGPALVWLVRVQRRKRAGGRRTAGQQCFRGNQHGSASAVLAWVAISGYSASIPA